MINLKEKIIKLSTAFLTLNLLFCGVLLSSSSADIPQNRIKDIKVKESKEEISILIDFSGNQIRKKAPLFYKKSIQLDIESASIETKRTIPIRNDLLKEIQVYYFSPGVVRTRLYLAKEGLDIKKGFHITEKENALLITINRKEAGLLKATPQKSVKSLDKKILNLIASASEITKSEEREKKDNLSEESQAVEPAADIESKENQDEETTVIKSEDTENRDNKNEEKEIVKSKENQENLSITKTDIPDSSKPDLTLNSLSYVNSNAEKASLSIMEGGIGEVLPGFMKMGGALLVVLALIFFSAAGAKKVLSKNDSFLGNNKLIKVLASSHIGVKKNILLVEVAGEMLVIGVSNDNITMLTKVEGDERANLARKTNSTEKPGSSSLFSLKNYFAGSKENKKEFSEIIDQAIDKKPVKSEPVNESDFQRSELIANVAKSIRKQAEILKHG